jgi:ubiquinone/menaquinone biosynthesis C-methylase UbiE
VNEPRDLQHGDSRSARRPPSFPGYAWGHDPDCSLLGELENNNPSTHNRATTYKAFLGWKQAQNPGRKLVGLEIGALHNKAQLGVDGIDMHYIDYLSAEELKIQYSEWKDTIQVPDIVSDAESLRGINDGYADFYIWSHVIEHTELSLRALNNSLRVVRPNGFVFLTVPNMCRTFDRQRLTTNWEHFVEEYLDESAAEKNRKEHFREWSISHLTAQDMPKYITNGHLNTLQPSQEEISSLQKHFLDKHYSIHYHTWTPTSLLEFLTKAKTDLGMKLDMLYFSVESLNLIVVLQRSA